MTKRIPISLLMVVLIAAGIFVATNASPARACAEPVSRILYSQSSECTSTLWVMNPDGTGASQVSLPYSLIRGISWAPGHNKIAFSLFKDSDFEIYVMDADGSNVTRITDRVGTDTAPSWSPDGTRLAWARQSGSATNIWTMNSDGTDAAPVQETPCVTQRAPAWSADGSRIAYTQTVGAIRSGLARIAGYP